MVCKYSELPLILYKHCADQIVRRCIPNEEMESVLRHCHSLECGEHFIVAKVLQASFLLLTLFKDAHVFVVACDHCQRLGSISRRN